MRRQRNRDAANVERYMREAKGHADLRMHQPDSAARYRAVVGEISSTKSSCGLKQSRDRLGPVLRPQLAQDMFDVLLHGAFGDKQPRRDGGISATQRDQFQHLEFTVRQEISNGACSLIAGWQSRAYKFWGIDYPSCIAKPRLSQGNVANSEKDSVQSSRGASKRVTERLQLLDDGCSAQRQLETMGKRHQQRQIVGVDVAAMQVAIAVQ
jgi:hypothetical protein